MPRRDNPFICYDTPGGCKTYLDNKGFPRESYEIRYISYFDIHLHGVPSGGWYIWSKVKRAYLRWDYNISEKINRKRKGRY